MQIQKLTRGIFIMNNVTCELKHVDGQVFLVLTSKLWDGEIVKNINITDMVDKVNEERVKHITGQLDIGLNI